MPHLQKRKIIRVGSSSFGVILPMPWLKYNKMKNGDLVEVISNGSIEIKPIEKEGSQVE